MPFSFGKMVHRAFGSLRAGGSGGGGPACDAHRALETIDVVVLVGREGERQDPLAEFAVSLIEIPR
jgi:hypothetical protein